MWTSSMHCWLNFKLVILTSYKYFVTSLNIGCSLAIFLLERGKRQGDPINGLGHKQKSWVKYTMGGVSYRNFWTSITQVREIIRGCPFTEL